MIDYRQFNVPPLVEAAAMEFARAAKLSGIDCALLMVSDGGISYLHIADDEDESRFLKPIDSRWYELYEVDE